MWAILRVPQVGSQSTDRDQVYFEAGVFIFVTILLQFVLWSLSIGAKSGQWRGVGRLQYQSLRRNGINEPQSPAVEWLKLFLALQLLIACFSEAVCANMIRCIPSCLSLGERSWLYEEPIRAWQLFFRCIPSCLSLCERSWLYEEPIREWLLFSASSRGHWLFTINERRILTAPSSRLFNTISPPWNGSFIRTGSCHARAYSTPQHHLLSSHLDIYYCDSACAAHQSGLLAFSSLCSSSSSPTPQPVPDKSTHPSAPTEAS